MKKAVVGASRPLTEAAGGAAGAQSLFFNYDGMGRQTNALEAAIRPILENLRAK